MTFETLTNIFSHKPIDGVSIQVIDGKTYVRFHLGAPTIRYVKKEEFSISPEEFQKATAPLEEEEFDDYVYKFLKFYTYYDRLYYYENDLILTGWQCVCLNEGKGDDDPIVTALGEQFMHTENIDFVNAIFIGRHIVYIYIQF